MEKIINTAAGDNWATASKEALKKELWQLDFAATDMVQYLDSHPQDQSALATMKEISRQRAAVHAVYVERFGPISATDITPGDEWLWALQNFPWDE